VTRAANHAFWWAVAGLVALSEMHASYWVITHSVNKFWLKEVQLEGVAGGLFSLDPLKREPASGDDGEAWKRLGARWEYAHLLRAALSVIALTSLTTAVAL